MGILNSTGQVIKNSKKFKEWEQEDADKQAQREALYEKKQLDDETLKKAAAKGKVIMDVVDIMDTHSEEVAENVETAVMPIAEIAPVLGFIGSTGGTILVGKEKIKNIAKKTKMFAHSDTGKKYQELHGKLFGKPYNNLNIVEQLKFELAGAFPEFFNPKAFENMDIDDEAKNSIKQIVDLKKDNKQLFDSITLKSLKIPKFAKAALFTIGGITAGSFILANSLGAKLQVKASRIARWQSREDLKDPKYFVQYTDEQIARAKNNIASNEENKNENKNKKGISFKGALMPMGGGLLGGGLFRKKDEDKFEKRNKGFFKTLFGVVQDNKNYQEWSKTYNPQDKKVKRELTQEELIEAQKDKEIIQRVTKKINNNAEEYSEDMEVAAGVLIGGTPFLGAGVSSLLNLFINKTGLAKKGEQKALNKALEGLSEDKQKEIKNLKEELKTLSENNEKGLGALCKKLTKGTEYIRAALSASIVKNEKNIDISKTLSKTFNFLKSTKFSRNTLIGITGTLLTTIVGSFVGLKLQKASARAGRYKAKQEIANDPRNFVGYSEQDFKEVENVKAKKKTFGQKVKETVTFIPRVIKDYIEYEKFRKTEAKQDKKLLNELVKLDVTDEQLNEAKDLQRKIFTTFENVDDKSQEYSESIEAMTEMAAPVIPFLGIGIMATPVVVALVKTFKGGGAHAAEVITGFLAKHTNFLKGKTAKKILGEVRDNVPKVVAETKLSQKTTEVVGEAAQNIAQNSDKVSCEDNVAEAIKKKFGSIYNEISENIGKNVDQDGVGGGVKTLEMIADSMEKSPAKTILNKLLNSGLTDKQLDAILKNLKQIKDNISPQELKEIIKVVTDEINKDPEAFKKILMGEGLVKIISSKTAINVAAISAGTWTALTLVLTYALESIFAGMQKNAGKLGVMTALNELGDEKYYANENTNFKGSSEKNEVNMTAKAPESKIQKPQSEMLKKMLENKKAQ